MPDRCVNKIFLKGAEDQEQDQKDQELGVGFENAF